MREQGAAGLLLASVLLLPLGRSAELPMALAALAGLWIGLHGGLDWRRPALRLAAVVFAGYWLPELVSALDSLDPARSWREVALDLRYLPMLLFWVDSLRDGRQLRRLRLGLAIVAALWIADALVQAATGWSLGGAFSADRLSGVFGADDLTLGPVLAVLSPFLLLQLQHHGRWPLGLGWLACVLVLLLAGTRAAWVMFAVISTALLIWQLGARRALRALAAASAVTLLLAWASYQASPEFAQRVDRTARLFSADRADIDHALAGRLPIWSTALAMWQAHPINGVGVRAYRSAYADYAAEDDPWVGFDGHHGAFHPHQLLLEILAETGTVGLACWLAALLACWRWRRRYRAPTIDARATDAALLALLFPLNTHYAFYSSAWGGLLLVLAALWIACHAQAALNTAKAPPPAAA